MILDVERLREDLKQECYAAYFGGGFGGALVSSFDVETASPDELIEIARQQGVDLRRYGVEE